MKKEVAKVIAIALAMAFMFCMGSHLDKPVPIVIQAIVGILMIVFSVASKGQRKKPLQN